MSKKLIILNALCLLFVIQFLMTTDFNNMSSLDYVYTVISVFWLIVLVAFFVIKQIGKGK
ncbi:hypothetical protein DeepPurple_gp017 [Bacillus phage Deep-Purple]|uniref:Uncharacterized protein n=1 Tax=Bacillus phage Deep-Purple TaxID=1873341 RepID=A0A1Z1LZM1_9CAUD|nr:hypothetical protein HWB22_gp18 [Bacillus phage Deep-Purple]ARW58268.1 hypothetical protein DeepPurple_gp017 [Bacillus phage Deep-Purple]